MLFQLHIYMCVCVFVVACDGSNENEQTHYFFKNIPWADITMILCHVSNQVRTGSRLWKFLFPDLKKKPKTECDCVYKKEIACGSIWVLICRVIPDDA